MSSDALPPSVVASRSLTSFIQLLDNYDHDDTLYEGEEKSKGLEPGTVMKYLRCIRGFLTSARARIIEAQQANVKKQLAVLAAPIQKLNECIFSLEREGICSPAELRTFVTEAVKSLLKSREQITSLASELETVE
jgi:hypothetical protein